MRTTLLLLALLDDNRLDLFMDYTVFHIGAYLTLLGAGVAYLTSSLLKPDLVRVWPLRFALFCFLIAGMAGGVIAGNMYRFTSYADFSATPIGPKLIWVQTNLWVPETWATIEHTAFWLGVFSGLIGMLSKRR
ncbi:MAG TPA: hypothetical protein VF527_18570 [Pyrinomonadaceae bacterium]|jgi:hypothetical protein